jgi:hypothetical protein
MHLSALANKLEHAHWPTTFRRPLQQSTDLWHCIHKPDRPLASSCLGPCDLDGVNRVASCSVAVPVELVSPKTILCRRAVSPDHQD